LNGKKMESLAPRRKATTARAKTADVIKLVKAGMKREDVARQLGIGVASVYRILPENGVRKVRQAPRTSN
jgi:DNA invertase Pin-like site-specific DNA recombinase